METRLIFAHALSPLHPGTGQGTGVIDLPIAREKATGLPYLPGSSLKGTLRSACEDDKRISVFGPETSNASDHAGALQISDLRLLLLPVRSLAGTFAWVTSPYVLRRFIRDARDCGMNTQSITLPDMVGEDKLGTAVITDKSALAPQGTVYLEDLNLTPSAEKATSIAEWLGTLIFAGDSELRTALGARLCVVHDDVLSFLLETATEVVARIRLKEDTKAVEKGGLWYEEALPAETVLAGLAMAMPNEKTRLNEGQIFEVITHCIAKPVQLGGKATVGRGLCRVILAQGA